MSKLNLQQLPDLVLEEIFLYCRGSLRSLTECNKFLKNYIETNPRLMRRLVLRVSADFYDEENFEACLVSKRQYCAAKFCYEDGTDGYDKAAEDMSKVQEVKKFADMHSATLKDVQFRFVDNRSDFKAVLHLLKFLEYADNVEKISVNLIYIDYYTWKIYKRYYLKKPSGWNWSEEFGDSYSFPNEFKNLKHLKMEKESPTVFNVFKNCENIETLECIGFGVEHLVKYDMLEVMLRNSRKKLKTLKVSFYHDDGQTFKSLTNFLTALTNAGIDLRTFCIEHLATLKSNKLLLNFVKSQKNLENLNLYEITGRIFNKKFGEVMDQLLNLQTLKLTFGGDNSKEGSWNSYWDKSNDDTEEENHDFEFLTSPWNLLKLKEFKLNYLGEEQCQVPYNVFQKTNEKLEKIEFSGNFKLYDSFFEYVSRNFASLIELKIEDKCSDYSSNDIFFVLKNLKQLQILQFGFPKESEFHLDLLVNNGNLNLPKIQNVELTFNDSIDAGHVMKLLQFMSNMSKFEFKYWKNCSTDFLVLVTKELTNLNYLTINEDPVKLEHSVLLKMQSNVREFNKNPDKFFLVHSGEWYRMKVTEKDEAGGSKD